MSRLGILLKPVIGKLHQRASRLYPVKLLNRVIYRNRTPLARVLDYWRNPEDAPNSPESYTTYTTISGFLGSIVTRYLPQIAGGKVLELGCNVGRNLNTLYEMGFRDLEGIEISTKAVEAMRKYYPQMSEHCHIYNAPIERIIDGLAGKSSEDKYSLVFSTAVMYHIHRDSDWVFPLIAHCVRPGGYLITIENEFAMTDWRHFPRNYKKVFEEQGLRQVEEINCGAVEYLKDYNEGFYARVFVRDIGYAD